MNTNLNLLPAQVEQRLASAYTESKAAALVEVVEEFFFDDGSFWEAAPLPTGVRDVTYEFLATMVRASFYSAEDTFIVLCTSDSDVLRKLLVMV